MSDSIYRHEAIKIITSYNGVVDKSVAKRLLLQMPSASTELSNNSPKLDNENGELISRQDAIRLAEQGQIQGFEWQFKKLCMLPSAEPRKRGKWILDPNGMDWNLPAWRCSLCGCKNNNIGVVAKGEGLGQNPLMWAGSKYCPNCGSYNGGEEE